jgi:ribonuclease E
MEEKTNPKEETPIVETPIVETPVVETPIVETPIVETPVVETPKKEESLDYKFEHLEFIDENEIQIDKIPKEIRKKMGAMKMLLGRYKKKPSDASKNTIIKHDITICDMLLSWKEQDYPDSIIEAPKKEESPVIETPIVETPIVETPIVETPIVETPNPEDKIAKMEEEVKEKLGDGITISVNDLKAIIKTTPNYPTQVVGSIKLEKMFLKPLYKKI